MIFTPRNKTIRDIDVQLYGVNIQRVFATKFLGVQIDSNLTWKHHIEYTSKKLNLNVLVYFARLEKNWLYDR